ncbi:MAG: EVE domain-containing protein [Gammaproteobacteria bacterium]|nr:EVE domain-containing protein [Gammaproteobacteria bacterium]
MKSEPEAFGIDDLQRVGSEPWDGIRNYQARNFMRDDMQIGDQVLFYHSNCKPPGIVGVAEIASKAYPDPTQFDPDDSHYDADSKPDAPRWLLVDVRFVRKLDGSISLAQIKAHADQLDGLPLIRKGNRLSIMPVRKQHFDYLLQLDTE